MLIFGRKLDERIGIRLPGNTEPTVWITVIELKQLPDGIKMRLGLEAPDDVEIHREEIWTRKQGTTHDNYRERNRKSN